MRDLAVAELLLSLLGLAALLTVLLLIRHSGSLTYHTRGKALQWTDRVQDVISDLVPVLCISQQIQRGLDRVGAGLVLSASTSSPATSPARSGTVAQRDSKPAVETRVSTEQLLGVTLNCALGLYAIDREYCMSIQIFSSCNLKCFRFYCSSGGLFQFNG